MTPPRTLAPRVCRGAALLALLAILGAGALYYGISLWDAGRIERSRSEATAHALAKAKAALVARAATDNNRPGSLPCPDMLTNISGSNVPGDGIADMLTGNDCPTYIGRLPWRTLGLEKLIDGHGEPLWYALSRSLRDDNSAEPINSETALTLSFDGKPGLAALILSPGPPVGGQGSRPSQNPADYLEGINASGGTTFISGPQGTGFNDRVLAITREELFRAVEARVAGEARKALAAYYGSQGYFPYANPWGYAKGMAGCAEGLRQGELPLSTCNGEVPALDTLPAWFSKNRWETLIFYAVSSACGPAHPNCSGSAYLAVGTNAQVKAIVAATGPAITEAPFPSSKGAAQVRPSAALNDALDSIDNADGNDIFSLPGTGPSENDQIFILP